MKLEPGMEQTSTLKVNKIYLKCIWKQYVSEPEKMYRLTCAPSGDSNQHAHPRSLRCPHEIKKNFLHSWLSKVRLVQVLIRQRE